MRKIEKLIEQSKIKYRDIEALEKVSTEEIFEDMKAILLMLEAHHHEKRLRKKRDEIFGN